MNLTEMKERLQHLLQIVEESGDLSQLSDLERDLALQNLRDIYSALRFGATSEMEKKPVREVAEPTEQPTEQPEVVAPVVAEVVEEVAEKPAEPNVEVVEEAVEPAENRAAEEVIEPTIEPAPIAEPTIEPTPTPTPEPIPDMVASEVEALRTHRSAMYALYEEESAEPILGESFSEKRAVADTIPCPKSVAEQTAITSLVGAIGVADRFMLIRELFDGDAEAYDHAISSLDTIGSFDDCMVYIAENYSWRPSSEGAKLLMELLQRKFNA